MTINVSFKVTGGKEFTIAIEPDITVLELKQKCAEHVDIPVESQRLIFKGKILKDKESLTVYNVADGNTMHLVRSAIASKEPESEKEGNKNENIGNDQNTSPSDNLNDFNNNPLVQMLMQSGTGDMNNFNAGSGATDNFNIGNLSNLLNANAGGEFNRESMSSLLSNPLARSLMNELSSNPEMLTNLVSNNPLLRNTFSQSPLMQPVLENPNLLREFLRPEILQAGLQIENALNMNNNNSNTASNNNSQRGLRMEDFLNNLNNFASTNTSTGTNNQSDNNNNNNAGNSSNAGNIGNNMNALFQSPELLQTFQQVMRANRNLGNFNFPNANQNLDFNTTEVADNRPPEEKYASQLVSLQEMGFIDNDANIQALQETGGDVNSAVTRLLEKGFN
ncbi:ubiquitin domain-containing protein DSK2 [Plasmodium brasilianum]|uniref:Ubiquitin domain-containing protein DSK2, putative n=2 Tax=Plasmodium (Plasmodium) TaxID=418103 RepID=A0A1A8W019_PLAMA|nr:ubiquitin domain-containing protein DSK2, putative [Plasmodium malariae]KAI4838258.1 ubiquitin domain-containing protein DSK2 [Plasmodium brasilianum]SBS85285.1 ubiquitin domain-containing protein DSK2, putative (DSK2) [Plasmodium malariae]SBT71233.1 ubiquitin domain-containing protein DSK2, putative [Plasmodium malariae]SCN12655.1 ubiquitin domain-containing protein DSK2, putative [Plasmodium malariae]